MGTWDVNTVPLENFYKCALMDIFHGFNYTLVSSDPNNHYTEKYKGLIKALPIAYERAPAAQDTIREYIFRGLFYLDNANRDVFGKLMKGTPDEKIWDALVEATNNSPGSIAQVFYQWCINQKKINDYIQFVHQPTLDEIAQTQDIPKLDFFNGNIRCSWVQGYLFEHLERSALKNKLIKTNHLYLLTKKNLWLLRNTIFAKYGRKFEHRELHDWFHNKRWYKENDAFTESLLSNQDKNIIKAILIIESKLSDEK